MANKAETFRFPLALGERLRGLRQKAGLTQQALAAAMGRAGKGGHFLVGRLERGEVPNPTIGVIADFLRACQASFSAVADLLDEYTRKPTVAQARAASAVEQAVRSESPDVRRAVVKYDSKVSRARAAADRNAADSRLRRQRALHVAQARVLQRKLRRRVVEVIESAKLRPGFLREMQLQNYAAKVWRVLNRTLVRSDRRPALLAEVYEEFLRESRMPQDLVRPIHDAVVEFHRQMVG